MLISQPIGNPEANIVAGIFVFSTNISKAGDKEFHSLCSLILHNKRHKA
jgi:hypothetical protein